MKVRILKRLVTLSINSGCRRIFQYRNSRYCRGYFIITQYSTIMLKMPILQYSSKYISNQINSIQQHCRKEQYACLEQITKSIFLNFTFSAAFTDTCV